ncbi:MAG: phosphatidic acid phosphatase type 2/haloperoxidase [Linnemannia gamsii]|nr:MAG: phosphatidic acid phosphatase type 2/haloperoxidase [Linnemannia gamsii]
MFRIKNPSTRFYCSYAFDWIFCVVLLGLFFLLDKVQPFHRDFSVENRAIMYPLTDKEAVPIWALCLIMAVFPAVLMFIVSIGVRKSPYDFHNGLLGLLLSVLLTTIFTQVIKVSVGKHRPDFLARCVPMMNGAPLIYDRPLQLWTIDVCTQTDKHILKDGMRSFPSGHASTAFAGLVYLALWMGGKMHVFDRKGYSLKPVLLFMPILAAILIAVSRVQDYRHSATDVTWGAIIGIIFAVFSYLQYYPSPTATNSHIPHPCRNFTRHTSADNNDDVGHLESAIGIRRNSGEFIDESGGQNFGVRGYSDSYGGQQQQQQPQQRQQQNYQLPQQQPPLDQGTRTYDSVYQVNNSNGLVDNNSK